MCQRPGPVSVGGSSSTGDKGHKMLPAPGVGAQGRAPFPSVLHEPGREVRSWNLTFEIIALR